MSTFNLKILSPEGIIFQSEANNFQTTTEVGRIGIYPNMTGLIGLLKPNISIVEANHKKIEYVLVGGLICVEKNEVRVFCDVCIEKSQIKIEDVKKEINQLEQLINKTSKDALKTSYEAKKNLQEKILNILQSNY